MHDRNETLLVDQIEAFREAVRTVRREKPFHIDAWVPLPEHLHAMWRSPEGDADYSGRWRLIKARLSRSLAKARVATKRNEKGESKVWQRLYWEHTIRDEYDYDRRVDNVHCNPDKHDWVHRVSDRPHSTFHRYVRRGVFDRLGWRREGE